MRKDVRIVVSAEDSPYMLWQCVLFRHSCRTRVGVEPYFVVHRFAGRRGIADAWRAAFPPENVIEAPGYRGIVAGEPYYPRNTAGTLYEAADVFRDGWIVLCDPDMIFVRDPKFRPGWRCARVPYGPEGGYYPRDAAKKIPKPLMNVGVPYVIHARWARRLASLWLSRMDAVKNYVWEISMWEYVLTLRDLRIRYESKDFVASNEEGYGIEGRSMIHYCYGSDRWDKRNFSSPGDAVRVFDSIPSNPSTDSEREIFKQLREVGERIKRGEPAR